MAGFLISADSIDNIVDTLTELKRLHQLNMELLEQLHVATNWLFEHNIPLPNTDTLYSLFQKSKSLLIEIQAGEPKILRYYASRQKVTPSETDEDETEPYNFPEQKRLSSIFAVY
jgi:hypothetical protein